LRNAVAEAMSMPIVMDIMACAGVSPMPMRLLPMVHEERQMPHVPEGLLVLVVPVSFASNAKTYALIANGCYSPQ
jgi:hypothetical protein